LPFFCPFHWQPQGKCQCCGGKAISSGAGALEVFDFHFGAVAPQPCATWQDVSIFGGPLNMLKETCRMFFLLFA